MLKKTVVDSAVTNNYSNVMSIKTVKRLKTLKFSINITNHKQNLQILKVGTSKCLKMTEIINQLSKHLGFEGWV